NVPKEAYYGAQTQRAVDNFPVSGLRFSREFIRALGIIKKNAAKVNAALGEIDEDVAAAIQKAAQEVSEGKFDDDFAVDIFQTGSGTSTNMNANEIIAKRANELKDDEVEVDIHPNDHVNYGQSSNDRSEEHTSELQSRSLHDALPIWLQQSRRRPRRSAKGNLMMILQWIFFKRAPALPPI